jgi:hypothetical protein
MSGTGFPSGSGLGDPAAWAVPVQPGVPDTRQVPAEPTDTQMLDWLTKNYSEICHSWDPEEDSPWEVHKVTGGRNDREWRRVARGRTLRAAIASAMKEHP